MINSWIVEINKEKFEEVIKEFPELYLDERTMTVGLSKRLPFEKVYDLAFLLQKCIIKGWVEIIVTFDEIEYKFDITRDEVIAYEKEWVERDI